jgi:dihydrofolate reductase
LLIAEETHFKEVFIVGGGEIYKQSMDVADKIYITRVHATLEGDTFFPEIKNAEWELVSNEDFQKDEKHQYDYSFQTWIKKSN